MNDKLPLPEPECLGETEWEEIMGYTADQMREYAALVRADERRACEKVCKDLYTKWVEELVNDANEEDDPPPPDWLDCKSAIEARGNT